MTNTLRKDMNDNVFCLGITSHLTSSASDSSTRVGDCSARSSFAASLSSTASMISSDAGTTRKDSSASRWGVTVKRGDQQSLQRWQSIWFGEGSSETWWEDPETWDETREFPDSWQPCQRAQFEANEALLGVSPTFQEDLSQYTTPKDISTVPWELQFPDSWQPCQWDQFKTNEELFGVSSTFQEDLSQYTTLLDEETLLDAFRRFQEDLRRLADVIACDITKAAPAGAGSDIDTEVPDEEELWAVVPRQDPGSSVAGLPTPVPRQVQDDHGRGSTENRSWFWDHRGTVRATQLVSEGLLQLRLEGLENSKVCSGICLCVTVVCFNAISCLLRLIAADARFSTGLVAIALTAVTAHFSGWNVMKLFVEDSPNARSPSGGTKAAQVESPCRGNSSSSSSGLPCATFVEGQATHWLDSPEHFRRACRRLSEKQLPAKAKKALGFAASAPGQQHLLAVVSVLDPRSGELCMLCVASARGEAFVFDLRSAGAGRAAAAALGGLLKDPARTKVFHQARRGVRALERQFGADVLGFWDTQVVDLVLRRRVYRENGTIAEASCLQELWKRYCCDLAEMDGAFQEISLDEDQECLMRHLATQAKAVLLLASQISSKLVEAFGRQKDFPLRIAELSRLHVDEGEEELDDGRDQGLSQQQQPSQALLQAVARAVRAMELQAVFDEGCETSCVPGDEVRDRLCG